MDRPRVLLAHNHRLLRDAFAALLEPHCEVVGTVADGYELLAAAAALHPDGPSQLIDPPKVRKELPSDDRNRRCETDSPENRGQ
jgi:hypothetical protein